MLLFREVSAQELDMLSVDVTLSSDIVRTFDMDWVAPEGGSPPPTVVVVVVVVVVAVVAPFFLVCNDVLAPVLTPTSPFRSATRDIDAAGMIVHLPQIITEYRNARGLTPIKIFIQVCAPAAAAVAVAAAVGSRGGLRCPLPLFSHSQWAHSR